MSLRYEIHETCQLPHDRLAALYHEHFPNKTDGCYVEVGAFDGVTFGHTSPLAKLGWRGLCIEPFPEYAEMCRKNMRGLNVAVETCAVGDHEGEVTLYPYLACSTTNLTEFTLSNGVNPNYKVQVPLYTLNQLLERNNIPEAFDVLCMDVEGDELKVLAAFDVAKWRPKMVISESNELHILPELHRKGALIWKFFKDAGYQRVYVDAINSIYVRA